MDRNFYICVQRDDGKRGAWEVPERLFDLFAAFMQALESGHPDVKWNGDLSIDLWNVQPRLVHTGQKKIAAIRLLRQYYGLDLRTAKEKADLAPLLLPTLSLAKAMALQADFQRDACGEIELPNALERMAKAL